MDTVVVIDTIVVLMAETSKSWFAVNAYWLVPVVTILVTLWGIRKSTKTSIKNTNDQIESQNKENHRPYINIKKVQPNCNKSEEGYWGNYIKYEGNEITVERNIEIENIGYGIATNIKIIEVKENYYINEMASNAPENESILSTLDLGIMKTKKINIRLSVPENIDDRPASIPLIIGYMDLNDNVYTMMLILDLEILPQYTYYPETSKNYHNMLRTYNVKYKSLIDKYTSRTLSTVKRISEEIQKYFFKKYV